MGTAELIPYWVNGPPQDDVSSKPGRALQELARSTAESSEVGALLPRIEADRSLRVG
jgi:hypothetical protein